MQDIETPSTPPELKLSAAKAIGGLVPQKTQAQYFKTYKRFEEWMVTKGATKITENVLLAYFEELSNDKKPTTLWSEYSMLKKMLRVNQAIDLGSFLSVSDLLKQKARYHAKKKAKTFKFEEIDKFLSSSPETLNSLQDKVALLFGLFGGLRSEEFGSIGVQNVAEHEDHIKVTIDKRKTDQAGNGTVFFVTASKDPSKCPLKYWRLYKQEFQKPQGPVFRQIRDNKFTNQKRGKSYFFELPKRIAEHLGIENPEKYTGHAIRRTATTWLAERGQTANVLQKFGGWKSANVANEYIDDTDVMRRSIADAMQIDSKGTSKIEKTATPGITINATTVVIHNSFNNANKD